MKIWLDGTRPAPAGFEQVRSVDEAKMQIEEIETKGGAIELLDLDHDLGEHTGDGGDAIRLLDWLAERGTFYRVMLCTANPVGGANMERMIARYWP